MTVGGVSALKMPSSSPDVQGGATHRPHPASFLTNKERQARRYEVVLSIFEDKGYILDDADYELELFKRFNSILKRDGLCLFHEGEREAMQRKLEVIGA